MAILATLGMAAIAALIAFYVLLVIANWKIFNKAGEPGWKSIIPLYSSYILFKITWKPGMFWITMILSVIAGALSKSENELYLIIAGVAGFVTLVIMLIDMYKLSKAFGHGFGFLLGLLFFPNIFTLILGFGKDRYIGPQ